MGLRQDWREFEPWQRAALIMGWTGILVQVVLVCALLVMRRLP